MTDGNKVLLPREIADAGGEERARQRYRLLAIEQAERIVRGTSQVASAIADQLVRDLYLIAEGSAIDASIARSVRNGAMQLRFERDRALAERPRARGMSAVEHEVDRLAHALLSTDADSELAELPRGSSPEDWLAWAPPRHSCSGRPSPTAASGSRTTPRTSFGIASRSARRFASSQVDPA